MSKVWKVACVGLLVVLLAACGPEQPTATVTAEPVDVGGGGEQQPPEATEEPTGATTVSVTENTNCRAGPGSNFDLVTIFEVGESANIIGQDASGQYWVISTADGECWLWAENAVVSGDTSGVAVRTSPPTPTAVPPPNWAGSWHCYFGLDSAGQFVEDDIVFIQTGDQLRVEISSTLWMEGTISDDGMVVGGLVNGIVPFSFHRNPNDLRQFTGIWRLPTVPGADLDFCGAKDGAPRPVPCRYTY